MGVKGKTVLAALLTFSIAFSLQNQALADNANRKVILDSFAESSTGKSEVYALPEAQVQKIINNVQTDYQKDMQFCETLTSTPCAGQTGLSLRIFLPVCTLVTNSLCIEALSISSDSNTPLVKANLLGTSEGRIYAADPARGFPEAGAPSLWSVPGVDNLGGSQTYVTKVLLDGFISSTTKKLFIFDLNAIVQGYTGKDLISSTTQLSEKQRVSLTLHLPNTVTGWLNGRLTDPNITISQIDQSQNRITVEANPVLVPEVDVTLTAEQEALLPNPLFFKEAFGVWKSTNAGNEAAVDWIKQLSAVMKDTSTGEHTSWFFSTAGSNSANAPNKCLQDKTRLLGLITTNSAAYSPGAPDFANDFLNYRVAGLHYRPDGKSLTIGTYDLLIKSDVARCLYNFTTAPISAAISVSYEGSDKQISTTIVSEKDGWLHLGAYGFTFSQPTLKVKLSGTVVKTSESKKVNTVITCKKGKTLKKITGVKPICPKGWIRQ